MWPATAEHLRSELEGRSALARVLELDVPSTWPPELYDEDAIRHTLDWLLAHPGESDWSFYYIVLRPDAGGGGTLIGAGGFKSAPDQTGDVEIGYSVLADYQRQGFATEALGGWVAFAFASGRVHRVIGQTLASLPASIRVLERAGFRYAGVGDDAGAPPGEQVLRYELARQAL